MHTHTCQYGTHHLFIPICTCIVTILKINENYKFENQVPIWEDTASLSGAGQILSLRHPVRMSVLRGRSFNRGQRRISDEQEFVKARIYYIQGCIIQGVLSDNKEHVWPGENCFTIKRNLLQVRMH